MDTPSPRKRKVDAVSGSSSSLSEASPLASPLTAPPPLDPASARPSPSPSTSSDGAHQPPPAASIAQYQTFGPNPLTFDDPTIYEIRPITDDMTDEEKKEIYCVASFPHDDLHDLIAVPRGGMDKDFSNAVKPNNQVAAHTFTAYLDNYLRPLKEEDMGFLNERVSSGERTHTYLKLMSCRVIGQLRSSCLAEASDITLMYGLRKMAPCRGTRQNKTDCHPISLAAAWIKWTMS